LRNAPDEDEDEVYSEPDEGVEIIDMENVRKMDWMAPESLRKEKKRMKLKKLRVKTEDTDQASNLKSKAKGISSALTLQSLTWLSI
jgi:DNA-directed RNA polymerase III subunit RPC4